MARKVSKPMRALGRTSHNVRNWLMVVILAYAAGYITDEVTHMFFDVCH